MSKKTISEKLKKKHHRVLEITDLKDLLNKSEERYSNRAAFKLKDEKGEIYKVTYSEFKQDVEALGTTFINLGLSGQAICVIGKNSYKWAVSYLAASIVGIVVPIDKELHFEDVTNFMNASESKVILGDEKYLKNIIDHKEKLNNPNTLFINFDKKESDSTYLSYHKTIEDGKEVLKSGDTSFQDLKIDPNELRILLFTSGTTGSAKGVCLSQSNICSNIMSTYRIVKVKRNDQVLSILPIHHTYECTLGYLLPIYSGACISYCEGLRHISKNISEFSPSIILSVPLLLEKMYKKIDDTLESSIPEKYKKEGKDLIDGLPFYVKKIVKAKILNSLGGRLRAFIVGAAAIKPELIEAFDKIGIKALQGYGLTECSPLVAGNNDFYMKYDSAGLPIPNVTYKINNPNEHGIGEIIVKGPNVMLGYYKNEEETNKVIKDGWFYTGDLGRVDEDGYLYITGRCKTVIVTKNGKNIYPEEVESYLTQSPLISEVLVSGMTFDDDDETYVNAQIIPNMEAITEYLKDSVPQKEEIQAIIKDVIANINKKLPTYKHIKSFKIREEDFEKTTTQKIKRFGNNLKLTDIIRLNAKKNTKKDE